LTGNKRIKLLVMKQSKGCKFVPKMHKNTIGGRAPPESAGGSYAHPTPQLATGGLIIREEMEGEWPTKADGREHKMAIVS